MFRPKSPEFPDNIAPFMELPIGVTHSNIGGLGQIQVTPAAARAYDLMPMKLPDEVAGLAGSAGDPDLSAKATARGITTPDNEAETTVNEAGPPYNYIVKIIAPEELPPDADQAVFVESGSAGLTGYFVLGVGQNAQAIQGQIREELEGVVRNVREENPDLSESEIIDSIRFLNYPQDPRMALPSVAQDSIVHIFARALDHHAPRELARMISRYQQEAYQSLRKRSYVTVGAAATALSGLVAAAPHPNIFSIGPAAGMTVFGLRMLWITEKNHLHGTEARNAEASQLGARLGRAAVNHLQYIYAPRP